jgi:hypothetical protein
MFGIGEVFSRAIEDYQRHWVTLALTILVWGVLIIALNFVEQLGLMLLGLAVKNELVVIAISLVVSLVNFVVGSFFSLGLVHVCLKVIRDQDPDLSDLFTQGGRLVQGVIAQLIVFIAIFAFVFAGALSGGLAMGATKEPVLAVVIGLGVAFVPMVLVSLFTLIKDFFIVDRELDAISALRASFDATYSNLLRLIGVLLVGAGLVLAGVFACVLPAFFVSFPIVMLALAHVYERTALQAEGDPYGGYGDAAYDKAL